MRECVRRQQCGRARNLRRNPSWPVDRGPSSPLRRSAVMVDRGVREPASPARLRRKAGFCGGRAGGVWEPEQTVTLRPRWEAGFPPCGGAPTPRRGTPGDFGPSRRLCAAASGSARSGGCSCVARGALLWRRRSRFAVFAERPSASGGRTPRRRLPARRATPPFGRRRSPARGGCGERDGERRRSGIWALAGSDHGPSWQLEWGGTPARPKRRRAHGRSRPCRRFYRLHV